jgi:hypothetical protein
MTKFFKLGDKVRLNDPASFYNGQEGIVVDAIAADGHVVKVAVYTIHIQKEGAVVSTTARQHMLEAA